MQRLNWKTLLLKERLNASAHVASPDFDVRTEFQRDIDRIVFSSSFRRLQDKTQVLPFPGSDFIHTRLTHSLEVASIGRSLGMLVGNFVLNEKKEEGLADYTVDDFGNLVVAGCLSHDIGNPPFGHSGEKAIGKAFRKNFELLQSRGLNERINEISAINDFLEFEGNAAGFRLLTNDHPSQIAGGLRLTYATLGTFTKYPRESKGGKLNSLGEQVKARKSQSKFGFFFEEREIFKTVADKIGLINLSESSDFYSWCRHPLSFLVEAADTFTYKIIDLEDAHKLGFISTELATNLLTRIVDQSPDPRCRVDDWTSINEPDERIGALRSKALNSLLHEAYIVFKMSYEEIMSGAFDSEIADVIPSNKILNEISEITRDNFFRHSLVIDVELSGFEVFDGLISLFVNAIDDPKDDFNKRLLLKLPSQLYNLLNSEERYYKKLLIITDFLSRMTDSYAIDLYRKLKGIELSNY